MCPLLDCTLRQSKGDVKGNALSDDKMQGYNDEMRVGYCLALEYQTAEVVMNNKRAHCLWLTPVRKRDGNNKF